MKNSILFISILFFINPIYSQKPKAEELKSFKVISYNIWNGYDWGKDTNRRKKMMDWMVSQSPDVVAFQELCGYTKEKLLKDAKEYGHSYAEIVKTSGYPVGITSNKPILVKEKILENMHHGALHCEISGIDFMVVHFSPFSYKKRHEESRIIISKLKEIRKQDNEVIVLGDFNAVSPFDAQFYKGNKEMLSSMLASEKKHKHVRNLLKGELEYGAISSYLSFPLIDVVQSHTKEFEERLSCPTQIFEKEMNKGRPIGSLRIDYILTSPELAKKCTYARVLNGAHTFYLSDHYPVMAEFKL